MKFKKVVASAVAGLALAFGGVAGGMVFAPASASAEDPFGGHYDGCTGQYDGSDCWSDNGGVIQHLDLGE